MSAHGEVIAALQAMRANLLQVGLTAEMGLMSAMELLKRASEEGREPTDGELIQAAAMLLVTAEAKLVSRNQSRPTGPDPAEQSPETDTG